MDGEISRPHSCEAHIQEGAHAGSALMCWACKLVRRPEGEKAKATDRRTSSQ